jgi:Tol biopolymer transport system component
MSRYDAVRLRRASVRDASTDTTLLTSVASDGGVANGDSGMTSMSKNGRYAAFTSYDTDLTSTDDADQETDLFIRNMTTGKTRWLSAGVPAGENPDGVVISPDGRWVSSRWDDGSLHLTRAATGVTSTVATDGYALLGAFSSQLGRFVFVSAGTPYVRNLSTGVNTAINTPPDAGSVSTVTISGNGQLAAFDWFPDNGGPSVIYRVAL